MLLTHIVTSSCLWNGRRCFSSSEQPDTSMARHTERRRKSRKRAFMAVSFVRLGKRAHRIAGTASRNAKTKDAPRPPFRRDSGKVPIRKNKTPNVITPGALSINQLACESKCAVSAFARSPCHLRLFSFLPCRSFACHACSADQPGISTTSCPRPGVSPWPPKAPAQ